MCFKPCDEVLWGSNLFLNSSKLGPNVGSVEGDSIVRRHVISLKCPVHVTLPERR